MDHAEPCILTVINFLSSGYLKCQIPSTPFQTLADMLERMDGKLCRCLHQTHYINVQRHAWYYLKIASSSLCCKCKHAATKMEICNHKRLLLALILFCVILRWIWSCFLLNYILHLELWQKEMNCSKTNEESPVGMTDGVATPNWNGPTWILTLECYRHRIYLCELQTNCGHNSQHAYGVSKLRELYDPVILTTTL